MWSKCVSACAVLFCTLHQQAAAADKTFRIGEKKYEHNWIAQKALPSKRSDMTASTVGDVIYLVGGCVKDQSYNKDIGGGMYLCGGGAANNIDASTIRYYPKTNTFDTTLPNAPRPRYRHAAAVVDKKIYLFGGVDSKDVIVQEVDVLDTATGKWSTLAERMPGATTDLTAFSHSGKIYTLGGYDKSWSALKTVQIYDPAAKKWTKAPDLNQGRGDCFSGVVQGKAYIIGGFHHENNFNAPVPSLEILDLATSKTWITAKAMKVARGDKAVALLHDLIHVVGGETKNAKGHSTPLRDVEVYDHVGNNWYFGGDIPSRRFRFTAAAHGDSIFIFGGQGFLEGKYKTDGSKYPLVDTVEEYSERVTVAVASSAVRVLGSGLVAALMALFLQ